MLNILDSAKHLVYCVVFWNIFISQRAQIDKLCDSRVRLLILLLELLQLLL